MEFLLDFYKPDIKYSIKNTYFTDEVVYGRILCYYIDHLDNHDTIILYLDIEHLDTRNVAALQYLLCLGVYSFNIELKYLVLLIVYSLTHKCINLVYLKIVECIIPIETPLYFCNKYILSYNNTRYIMDEYFKWNL
jgi:hypothetical protein